MGLFLICSCCSQSFATTCATTIQNIAPPSSCHSCTKTVCANTTCLRRLVCAFCCHDLCPQFFYLMFFCFRRAKTASYFFRCVEKIHLCVYLITGFIKTQPFYLDFINPADFKPSIIIQYMNIYANNFQNGKNIVFLSFFISLLL